MKFYSHEMDNVWYHSCLSIGETTQTSCLNEKLDGDRPLHIMSFDQGFQKVT